jgi:hypothetical protein
MEETSLDVGLHGPFPYCPFVNRDVDTGLKFLNAWAGLSIFSALEMVTKAVRDNARFADPPKSGSLFDALQVRDSSVSQRGFVQSFGIKFDVSFFELTINLVGVEESEQKDVGYCAGIFCFHAGFDGNDLACIEEEEEEDADAVADPT